jgi:hypothetical protein
MFKSVEYAGFDDHPALRAEAERATLVLASEVGTWHDRIEVEWEARPDNPKGLELTLALDLPIGSGTGSRFIPIGEFADDDLLRHRLRGVWDRALGGILEKRKKVWDEILHQPAEA